MVSPAIPRPAPFSEELTLRPMNDLATHLVRLWEECTKEVSAITPFPEEVFSCEGVAEALGIRIDQVAKAMLVEANAHCGIALLPGCDRLDMKALQAVLGSKKVSIVKGDDVSTKTGMIVGAVTPLICLKDPKVFLVIDSSLRDLDCVNISTGDLQYGLNVNPKQLGILPNARWASLAQAKKV